MPQDVIATTCGDVLYRAFREARILKRPAAGLAPSEATDGIIFLNQQVDYWSARGCYAWTNTFTLYPLTPGHQPYLIGPGLTLPDWTAPQRPTSIISCSLVLNTNPAVDLPINIRDAQWWAAQQTKTITTSVPTDLYFQTAVPNGQIFFWPVANTGDSVRLETEVQLQQFNALTDPFIAPQAYLSAITLTLAEELVDIWATEMPQNLAARAMKARAAVQSNNYLPPRIASADWGTFSRPKADFNYLTGTVPNS